MIAKLAPARRGGRGSFHDLRHYLEFDKLGNPREDLLGTWSGNVATHQTADLEMETVAARGRAADPVFHVILSWRPGEVVAEETIRGAIDATMRSLEAERHQWYAAAHFDDDTGRTHLHLMVNKIHPRTHKVLDQSWSKAKLGRAAEWIERTFGCLADRHMNWRAFDIAEREYGAEPDFGPEVPPPDHAPPRSLSLVPEGAKTSEMDAAMRAGYSWARLVREEAVPVAQAVAIGEGASWERVHATLETYGLRMVAAGSGARIVGTEPGLHLKASRAGLDVRELAKTLGPFVEPDRAQTPHDEQMQHARGITAAAESWTELHAGLAEIGLALDAGRGGRSYRISGTFGNRPEAGSIKKTA